MKGICCRAALAGVLVLYAHGVYAEGSFQAGLNQPLQDFHSSGFPQQVDIVSAGEVINVSLCGVSDADLVSVTILDPDGTSVYSSGGIFPNVSCSNDMSAPLTSPIRYTTLASGAFSVRMESYSSSVLKRFDITVTPDTATNPDPTISDGRLWALGWAYDTGTFSESGATDADYYVLIPGGRTNTDYVWKLDLNKFSGYVYTLVANDLGVAAPYSGYSVPTSGNKVCEKFPLYFGYPVVAESLPTEPPVITGGLTFVDSAGEDFAITPNNDGVQDSGTFEFDSDVEGTYAITIDTNGDGAFGSGDKLLLGNMVAGLNQVVWDGTDADGTTLATGRYAANLETRLGEYHFIANDAETSGGDEIGLTIYLANSDGTASDTTVYWDDATLLGATSNLPNGTLAGRHTWGTFESDSIGNNAYIDTYVHGLTSSYTALTAISDSDTPITGVDGVLSVAAIAIPGDVLSVSVSDADLNILSGSAQTATVEVINGTTGEQEQLILNETDLDSGIFSIVLATAESATSGTNNDGSMNMQDGDILTFVYRDQLDASGGQTVHSSITTVSADHDGDGVPDIIDLDDDNDGIPDSVEGNGTVDSDGDGIPDSLDLDSNGDGISDLVQAGGTDSDGDGMVDGFTDANGDGMDDNLAASPLPMTDSDGDGVPDCHDNGDQDGDDIADTVDLDDDNDGIPDSIEGNGTVDSDGDGIPDSLDLDSDNDGIYDLYESGIGNSAALDSNGDGRIDSGVGSNGLADTAETSVDSGVINYTVTDTDNDGIPDFRDLDSDNDGINDVIEAGGSDPDNDGVVGNGTPSVDGDGLAPGSGLTPPDTDGDGTPDQQDLDSDGDGINDVIEAGGSDPDGDGMVGSGAPAVDGSGLPVGGGLIPPDSDGDGIPDCLDNTDTDSDGVPDTADLDDDNDGIRDSEEGNGSVDTDGDGVADSLDLDSDNDGLTDLSESGIYAPETLDSDSDGRIDSGFGANGLADIVETGVESGVINYTVADSDGDTTPDFRDLDSDNDGIHDVIEANGSDVDGDGIIGNGAPVVDVNGLPSGGPLTAVDSDGDTIPDFRDLDSDNDGLYDVTEAGGSDPDNDGIAGSGTPTVDSHGDTDQGGLIPPDTDGDGVSDQRDLDSDNDGIPDVVENGGSDPDGDGVIGDGVPTVDEHGVNTGGMLVPVDSDGDGIPNHLDLDSNGDGISDLVQAGGTDSDGDDMVDGFNDANGDGLDDGVAASPLPQGDSDGDGMPDYKDCDDRDNDGTLDTADLDNDNDGIPNGIEGNGAVDTDGDGVPDDLDLDSDNDGIYDLYESGIVAPAALDLNSDGRIDSGVSVGGNGLADAVETAVDSGLINYSVADTDGDGVPDYRDLDSDNDTIPDVIESGGSDPDGDGRVGSGDPEVNDNGVPSGGAGIPRDSDSDGIPDQRDRDSDGDGIDDVIENGGVDANGDGMDDNYSDADGDGYTDTPPSRDTGGGDSGTTNDNSGNIETGLNGVGGCSVARNAPFDPLLPLLLLISLLWLQRKRIYNQISGGREG